MDGLVVLIFKEGKHLDFIVLPFIALPCPSMANLIEGGIMIFLSISQKIGNETREGRAQYSS